MGQVFGCCYMYLVIGQVFGSPDDLMGYHTLQGDNSLKSVESFDHMMFVCRFQASW